MVKSRELRQKLGEQTDAFRKLIDVGHEKRSAEQNAEMDRIEKDILASEQEIARVEAQEARERTLGAPAGQPPVRPDAPAQSTAESRALAFRKQHGELNPTVNLIAEQIAADNNLSSELYASAFHKALFRKKGTTLTAEEQRSLDMGVAADGGYTVPAQDFVMMILKRIDEENVIRPLATKFTVAQAQTLGVPAMSADPADADWTTELATGNEDSTLAFGNREMRPWPVAKLLKVSDKLLRASPLGIEAFVRDRLALIVARAQSKAFNTGDGVNKPLGIYTASANGIPAGQDQSIVTAGAQDPDKIIAAKHQLRPVYWKTAKWHMHPVWLGIIRKLKTTSPIAYLWEPGLAPGNPSTILGLPYVIDEYAPSVTTTGAGVYGAVLGDFSYYWIADALDMRIQRLDELYAATAQVGFIVRAEADAQPVLGEAFVRLLNN